MVAREWLSDVDADLWTLLGEEAMVAWDRDVAPHLTSSVEKFELGGSWHHEDGCTAHILVRGMVIPSAPAFSASASWFPDQGRWRSTFDGWLPAFLRGSLGDVQTPVR